MLLSRITPRVNAKDPVMRRRLKNEHKHTRDACVVSFTQPSIGKGNPDPHARQERLASSVSRSLEDQQRRKSPVRRCFKSRSSAENGVRRFASGCRNDVDVSPASCPVPRRPTHDHRHVRFGQSGNYAVSRGLQEIFCGDTKVFSRRRSCEFIKRPDQISPIEIQKINKRK
mgnify:FL=1